MTPKKSLLAEKNNPSSSEVLSKRKREKKKGRGTVCYSKNFVFRNIRGRGKRPVIHFLRGEKRGDLRRKLEH